jgi:excisionase family DNA binding protein
MGNKYIRDESVHTSYWPGVSNANGDSMGSKRKSSATGRKPDTYSVPEAGRIVGLGKNASYDAARRGELPTLRFGRLLKVPRAALERMLGKA